MRILLCSHHYPPRHRGGVEIHTARLAHALAEQGEEVAVVTSDDDPLIETGRILTRDDAGVEVNTIGNDRLVRSPLDTLARAEVGRAFETILERVAPDVVHFQHVMNLGLEMPILVASRGIPVLITLHEYWLLCPRGGQMRCADGTLCEVPDLRTCSRCLQDHRFGRSALEVRVARMARRVERLTGWNAFPWLKGLRPRATGSPATENDEDLCAMTSFLEERRRRVRAMLEEVDVVLSPSRFLIGRFAAAGFDVQAFRHWPNGVPEWSPEVRDSGEDADRDGSLRVGFLGSIVPQKGLDLLVEAHRRLPRGRIEVHVHGDVTFDPVFWSTVRERSVTGETRVHGPFTQNELAGILARLDVLVVPSRWYENAPLVISEARRAGVPVVAARLGGMAEMVRDGVDGLLFEPGDADSLAACLERLAAEPAARRRMAAAAPAPRALAEEARDLRRLYAELRARPRERTT